MAAPDCKHEPFQVAKVFGDGFRRAGKASVGLEIDRADAAAQPLEERGHDDGAGAANAVERDVKSPAPNALDVDVWYRKDTIDVSLNRTIVCLDRLRARPSARAEFPARRAHASRCLRRSRETGPVGPMNLSAFHSMGLWLAEIIRPPAA